MDKLVGSQGFSTLLAAITLVVISGWRVTTHAQLSPSRKTESLEIAQSPDEKTSKTIRLLHTLTGHRASVETLLFSADGDILVSGGRGLNRT